MFKLCKWYYFFDKTIYLSLDDINETQRGDEEKVVDGTLCISDIEEVFFDTMEEMPGESMCTG